jgi:hypothetical protein
MAWIQKIKRWLIGEPYPFIGGPLDGHKMRLDRPRYLYPDIVDGKECVHIYRFTTLRLSNDAPLQAFVSETLDASRAVQMWERISRSI